MRAYPVLHPIWQKHFLKLLPLGGIIESELVAIPAMQKRLEKEYQQPISGQLLLKKDSHLPHFRLHKSTRRDL
ncbi:D-serine ammonia-lyase [Escherichia coli]|uniref:D-serine ammonia-lyase n=1 Tax=Escherichia coli TaxID=562 RepID=A0A376U5P1_ECOLX|nr:D-serine ammonia-lyase [Escherichia coli]